MKTYFSKKYVFIKKLKKKGKGSNAIIILVVNMEVITKLIEDIKVLIHDDIIQYNEEKITTIKNVVKNIDKDTIVILSKQLKEDDLLNLFYCFCISDNTEFVEILKEQISKNINYEMFQILVYFKAANVFKLLFDVSKVKNIEQFLFDTCEYPNYEIFKFLVTKYNIDINKKINITYIEHDSSEDIEEEEYFSQLMIACDKKNYKEIIKIIDFLFSQNITDKSLISGWHLVDIFEVFTHLCEKYEEKNGKEKIKTLLENDKNILEKCCENGILYLEFLEEKYDIKFNKLNKSLISELKKKPYCEEVIKWLQERDIKIKLELNYDKMIATLESINFTKMNDDKDDMKEKNLEKRLVNFLEFEKFNEEVNKIKLAIKNNLDMSGEYEELDQIEKSGGMKNG